MTTGAAGLGVPLTGSTDMIEVEDGGPGVAGCCVVMSVLGATEGALFVAVMFGVGLVAGQGEG